MLAQLTSNISSTRQAVGLTSKARRFDSWRGLEAFALRYASPGSTVRVFVLHSKDGTPVLASEFEKKGIVPYQTPGCIKRGDNGVKLPPFIQIPIEKARLDSDGLIHWNEAMLDIKETLGAKKCPASPQDKDQKMFSEEIAIEETQIAQSCLDFTHE